MTRHIYAFGSLCRGELDEFSDIDLLACVDTQEQGRQVDVARFSVYTTERVRSLWAEGNPFAWHLHLESRLLFSSNGRDFLGELGRPHAYLNADRDRRKFKRLFEESLTSLTQTSDSRVFHLSCIFLATRNFATCHSFTRGSPIFSRRSPLVIDERLPLSEDAFRLLVRARILSTRGIGKALTSTEIALAIEACEAIRDWMHDLLPSEVHA